MRVGLFPGQAAAMRAAYVEQRRRLSRRGLFLAVGASVVAGACGFVTGKSTALTPITPTPPEADPLQALALGPIEDLRRQAMHIESALESTPAEPVLGIAFQRLLTVALVEPDDEILARRLLRIGERQDVPPHVTDGARLLQRARKR